MENILFASVYLKCVFFLHCSFHLCFPILLCVCVYIEMVQMVMLILHNLYLTVVFIFLFPMKSK